MLLGFLLVLLVLVCIALSTVILLQRSEGGALGMGGGPSGFMSARGAGDLLTRTTAVLAGVFFLLCLLLTVLSGRMHSGGSIVDRLKVDALSPDALSHAGRPQPAAATPGAPAPAAPTPGPNTAIFEAPPPQVHTTPADTAAPAQGAAGRDTPPTAADSGAHRRSSTLLGVQTAPQSTPTFAPLATPRPAPPAAAREATPAPATAASGNSTGGV